MKDLEDMNTFELEGLQRRIQTELIRRRVQGIPRDGQKYWPGAGPPTRFEAGIEPDAERRRGL